MVYTIENRWSLEEQDTDFAHSYTYIIEKNTLKL
jgi:hypothetical protein